MRESSQNRNNHINRPNNIENLKQKLVEALEEEIQKIEEEGLGSSQYRVNNGQKIKQEGEFCIYRFVTDDIIELPEDLPVEIKISNDIARGHIFLV